MSTPLRDLITRLAADSTSQAAFADDPAGFLAEHGWGDLDGQDVGTALGALADEAPIEQAARLGDVADGLDGVDGAITGLGAAAAVFADVPGPNGEADEAVELAADDRDPSLGIDEDGDGDDGPDIGDESGIDDIDDESHIDDIDDIDEIDDVDDGPDGPDGLDVPDDELDTSTFRAPGEYEDDGEEAPEPAADAEPDADADADADAPALPADPDNGIDEGADHESFIDADDGDAAAVPEPEDDDDL
jgi:hypothetical protein